MNIKVTYPKGWIFDEMKRDLDGFVGNLDIVVPDIITKDDIYVKDRLTKKVKAKDVGAIAQDADWEVQYLWWNSESFSNWLDGFVRNAYLIKDEKMMDKAKNFIYHILESQDDDGYIGIYDEDLRYNFSSENGELWAQATFYRAAMSYYELTKEEIVFEKIKRAVDHTMEIYKIDESTPFNLENDYAGACHGLMFVDVCYTIYKYTNEKKYVDYAAFLYEDYSKYDLSEKDIIKSNLEKYDLSFFGHGPHIYEHFRAVILANLSNNGKYENLIQSYLLKLFYSTTPSGGPIGDEWVFNRTASATDTGYEYCSLQELLHSYGLLLELTNDKKIADKMEWLFYNAAFGARHPHKSQIAYCQRDNAYKTFGKEPEGKVGENVRYKYSTAHQDAAVCCVPNAGRILTYFLEFAYSEYKNGLNVDFYVPSTTQRTINNVSISIEQETNYPFQLESTLKIKGDGKLPIRLRKPEWATNMTIECVGATITETDKEIIVEKTWSDDVITISFDTEVKEHFDFIREAYYSYGPLVYSLKIEEDFEAGRDYGTLEPDSLYSPKSFSYEEWNSTKETLSSFKVLSLGESFQSPTILEGVIEDNKTTKKAEFFPMGSTLLRKVTFKKK